MPDTYPAEVRSRVMRAVKGAGNAAETILAQLLVKTALRFRPQAKELPGSPDFVNDRLRMAIFVDGDFWHGRWWREAGRAPQSNRPYWIGKFERNHKRDRRADRLLRSRGWCVIRVWESDLLGAPDSVLAAIRRRVARRVVTRRLATAAGRPLR